MTEEAFAPFEREETDHMAMIRRFAEADIQRIAENTFQPTLIFNTDADTTRLFAFPEFSGDVRSRDEAGWAMAILCAAIDDLWSVALVADTYHVTQPTKHDGSPWNYGDMQHAFDNKTVDADLVKEALTYTILEGDQLYASLVPYVRDASNNITLQWDDAHINKEDESRQALGFWPDVMRHAFSVPKVMNDPKSFELMTHLDLSMERARLHTLCAAIKHVMKSTNVACLIPCASEDEQEILKMSFGDAPNILKLTRDEVEEIVDLETAWSLPNHDLDAE